MQFGSEFGKKFFAFGLRGTEEMKLFSRQDDRLAALDRVQVQSSGRRILLESVLAVALIVVAFLLAPFVRDNLGDVGEFLGGRPMLLALLLVGVSSPFLLRARVRRGLRFELIRVGIPVCVECCYHLKGLQTDVVNCPECGTPIDKRAQGLLAGDEPELRSGPTQGPTAVTQQPKCRRPNLPA